MFDIATKYCFALDNNSKKSMRLFLLLFEIENYTNGAIIQMNRLERHRSRINKKFANLKNFEHIKRKDYITTYLACDTHYFFICIDKIYKLLNILSKELNDKDIKKLRANINNIFHISTIRNHLEHIEDRCVGYLSLHDKKQNIRKHIGDFGNFSKDGFTFNNKKYPSNKKSLDEIKKTYQDLIQILHDNYASKNSNFIKRQEMEEIQEKMMKNLKKFGLIK
jgi:hypothetical protein